MTYETTETTGKEGYPQAQGMWLKVFPNSTELEKKYPWYFGSKYFPSNLYLLRKTGGSDVLGAIGFVSRAYNSRDGEKIFGLCSDFAVDQEHQTLAPALQILKSLIKGSRNKCDLLMGFPNNKAVPVMRRAGFRILGEFSRYALILDSKSYINQIFLSRFSSMISVPINFLLKCYFWASRCKHFKSYDLIEIFRADESFDDFWDAYSEQSNLFIGRRDQAYINWRFFSNPGEKSHVFAFRNKKTQALVGYAVVRINNEGNWYLFDFLTLSDSKYLKCLIQKLISEGIKGDAISLSLEFLGSQEILNLLESLKFSKRYSERRVILHPLEENKECLDIVLDVNNWHITSADELG